MVSTVVPRYILDTNILIAYIRASTQQHPNNLGQRIEATYQLMVAATAPLICIVSEGELQSLAMQFNWGNAKVRQLDQLVRRFAVINLDFPNLVNAYAQIDDYSRRRGISMGKNDIWIAATSAVTGAHLLTTDKDFDHLDPQFLSHDYIDPNKR